MHISLVEIEILITHADVEEGSRVGFGHKVLSKTTQEIDGTCDTSKSTKSDKTIVLFVSDLFVVNESDFGLDHIVQCSHVCLLSLNGVREEHVGLLRVELLNRHFLNTDDE